MVDFVKVLFDFLDKLTILDVSCIIIMYAMFSLLVLNAWINFKFLNIAECLHIAVFSFAFFGSIFLYFFEKKTFNSFYSNVFVQLTFLSNVIIFAIYALYEVIKRYQENKIFADVKSYNNVANKINEDTSSIEEHKWKNYRNNMNDAKGVYPNYNYYYNKDDKYAEPHTSRPVVSSNIPMKNEIDRLNRAIDDLSRAINNRTYDDKNEKEIKVLQEKLQVLHEKINSMEVKNEELKAYELENFEKKLQMQKEKNDSMAERNKDMIKEVKDEINNIKQNVNNIHHNVNYIRNENDDMFGNLKRQIDILKNQENEEIKELKNQLETKRNSLLEEKQNSVSAVNNTINNDKLDLIDKKIDEIIDKNKQLTENANNFGNKFGEKLALQLEKLTDTIENEKKLADEKTKQQLLQQKAADEAKKSKIEDLQHEINNLERKYEQQKNNDNLRNENTANDVKLTQVIPYDQMNNSEKSKNEVVVEKDKVVINNEDANIVVKNDKNGNLVAERTFDVSAFEENILDKVKNMLRENNASLDEKFGLIRVDMVNLKDGVQGVVDRMTKLFELLTITVQNNKNHTL